MFIPPASPGAAAPLTIVSSALYGWFQPGSMIRAFFWVFATAV